MSGKTCTVCRKTKSLDDFGRTSGTKANKDGRRPLCLICGAKKAEEYRQKNPKKISQGYRNENYRTYFGGSGREARAKYDALLDKQQHLCAICGRHESDFKRALAVDHDHATGRVRGLLCIPCNTIVVPAVEQHITFLEKAALYLRGKHV